MGSLGFQDFLRSSNLNMKIRNMKYILIVNTLIDRSLTSFQMFSLDQCKEICIFHQRTKLHFMAYQQRSDYIRLMKQVTFPLGNMSWEYFIKARSELVF